MSKATLGCSLALHALILAAASLGSAGAVSVEAPAEMTGMVTMSFRLPPAESTSQQPVQEPMEDVTPRLDPSTESLRAKELPIQVARDPGWAVARVEEFGQRQPALESSHRTERRSVHSGSVDGIAMSEVVPAPRPLESRRVTLQDALSSGSADLGYVAASVAGDNPPPRYPDRAKRLGQEGIVSLELRISSGGRVEHAKVLASSGHALLDDAALTQLATWRFQPACLSGVAVAAPLVIQVWFRLDSGVSVAQAK